MSPDGEGGLGRRRLGTGLRRVLGRLDIRRAREPGRHNHISLGSHCHMAQVLKTLGLRTWSGPFDWIFSTPGMVRDCLADDFAALSDRSLLETIPVDERPKPDLGRCRHRLYRDRYALPCVFNHHDPAADPTDYAFLQAGIRRFRTARDDSRARNHFWLMTETPTDPGILRALCDALTQDRDGNLLTHLQVVPDRPAPRLVDRVATGRLHALTLETTSKSTGLRFGEPADDRLLARLVEREAAHASGL